MTRREISQMIKVRNSTVQTFEERVAYWERALVGQLARIAHESGEQFVRWPVSRQTREQSWANSIKLTVQVETEVRP